MHLNNTKKGFTLAELLIVIAIIAILIAIAVPVFTSSMKRAQKTVDDGNFRIAKSMAAANMMSGFIEFYDYTDPANPSYRIAELGAEQTMIDIKDENGNVVEKKPLGFFVLTSDGHFADYNQMVGDKAQYIAWAKYTSDENEHHIAQKSAILLLPFSPDSSAVSDDEHYYVNLDDKVGGSLLWMIVK